MRTNLDLISQLEDPRNFIVAVVLAGRFAKDRELATFLIESYPGLKVIDDETYEIDAGSYRPAL